MKIEDLKEIGYEVEVTHLRWVHGDEGPLEIPIPTAYVEPHEEIIPNGGVTVVDIFDKEGNVLSTGIAHCSIEDNFNKRIGRQLALGRAIYQLDLKGRRKELDS